jgi:hypothetical protein
MNADAMSRVFYGAEPRFRNKVERLTKGLLLLTLTQMFRSYIHMIMHAGVCRSPFAFQLTAAAGGTRLNVMFQLQRV